MLSIKLILTAQNGYSRIKQFYIRLRINLNLFTSAITLNFRFVSLSVKDSVLGNILYIFYIKSSFKIILRSN